MSDRAIIIGRDDEVAEWVKDRCDNICFSFPQGKVKSVGIALHNRIVAGWVYSNYQPEFGTIEMSIASITPRWVTRGVLNAMFSYPFEDLDCQRIGAITRAENSRLLKFAKGLGFRQEARLRRAYGRGKDAVLLRLFKEDWLKSPFGKA